MSVLLLLLLPTTFAHDGEEECTATSCPMRHANVTESWDADRDKPPIDKRVPSHLRTATFALG